MDTAQIHARLGELFLHAARLEDGARAEYLDEVCAGDTTLREQVETMLHHHLTPAVDLERPIADVRSLMVLEQAMPERIGRYRLIRPIGRGGMALVYLAEQSQPRREVALKVIRPGCFSQGMVRRFEIEVETLGRLRHSAIAQILEAGTAMLADGTPVPYFAMEYVPGKPLLEFARDAALDRRGRMRLLQSICAGVQAAHRQGVIHRDLKPSNVLVVVDETTGEPQPKILDFGVARATEPTGDAALLTIDGQLVGTLPYMSPEQVSGDVSAVDTRSDVYALGVIAFELIAGASPYATTPRSHVDWIRAISNERVRRLSEVLPSVEEDLAAVVAQALAKDPAERYQTAAALGDDLAHVLAGRPISARRDTMITMIAAMRRHARRYRWTIAASLVVAAGLGGFAAFAKHQSDQLLVMATAEKAARDAADSNARDAEQARAVAEGEAKRASAVTDYVLDTLGMADPDVSRRADAGVRRMLDASAASVERLHGEPEVEASVRAMLGRAYYALGAPSPARDQLMRALKLRRREASPDPRELYGILWPYHFVVRELGETPLGDPEGELGELGQKIVSGRDQAAGAALNKLFAAATAKGEQRPPHAVIDDLAHRYVAEIGRAFPTRDEDRLLAVDQLFLAARRLLRRDGAAPAAVCLDECLRLYRDELPETNSRVVRALDLLVTARIGAGEHEAAEALARHAIATVEAQLPPDHWYIAVQRLQLGAALAGQGRLEEALRLVEESRARLADALAPGDDYTTRALRQLCVIAAACGNQAMLEGARKDLAAELGASFAPARVAWRRVFDPSEPMSAAIERLSAVVRRADDSDELAAAIDGALAAKRAAYPDDDPRSAVIADLMSYWGETAINDGGDPAIVQRMFDEAARYDAVTPARHPRKRAHPHWWLAKIALDAGDAATAEHQSSLAIELLEQWPEERLAFNAVATSTRGVALCRLGQCDEGLALLESSVADLLECEGANGGNLLNATEWMVAALDACGRSDEIVALCDRHLDTAEVDRTKDLSRRFGLIVALHAGDSPTTVQRTLARFRPAVGDGAVIKRRAEIVAVLLARLGRWQESAEVQPNELSDGLDFALAALRAALGGDVAGATAALAQAEVKQAENEYWRTTGVLEEVRSMLASHER